MLVAVEWPFASFQMTEAARTWVFGTAYHPYFMHPDWAEPRYVFFHYGDWWSGLAWAVVAAIGTSYLGLLLGDAIAKVRR